MKFNNSPQRKKKIFLKLQYKEKNNIPLENANTLATNSGMKMAQHSRYRYKDVHQEIRTLQGADSRTFYGRS